jgi:hypothetical protein
MVRIPTGSTTIARCLAAALFTFALTTTLAHADAQDSAQQGCINAMNGNGAKVAAAQGKENSSCVKGVGSGKVLGTADACLTADSKLKVAKAKQKVSDGQIAKCTTAPDFGLTNATTVNNAATSEEVNLTKDVFSESCLVPGDCNSGGCSGGLCSVNSAIIDADVDKDGASCQAAVVKAYEKISSTALKQFAGCKKSGLKGGTIIDETGIEGCVNDDTKGGIAGATTKLGDTITSKCAGVNLAAAFPGCNPVNGTALRDCAGNAAKCRACIIVNKMDGVNAPCDDLDNGALDGSCPQCGNNVVDAGEDCDTGGVSATCDADCTTAKCNDGILNTLAGEECEDNNQVDTDPCTTQCLDAVCGDGIVCSDAACTTGPGGAPEQCDLGGANGGTLCSASCGLSAADPQCPNRADLTLFAATGRNCATNADCPVGTCTTGKCRTVTDLDTGWTGIAHDADINDDYGTRGHLVCPGPDPGCGQCIITGLEPSQPADNCRCAADNRVSCNVPFGNDVPNCGPIAGSNDLCDCYLGGPLPLSAGNTPACVLNKFARDVIGTANVDTGSGELDVNLRSVVFLGETLAQPCPYCSAKCTAPAGVVGNPCKVNSDCNPITGVCTADTPKDGIRNGVCVSGRNATASCDLDEVNSTFPAPGGGGMSFDCFPDAGKNVSGAGLTINIHSTTGPQSLGFNVPCGFPPGGPFYTCPCGVCTLDVLRACADDTDCTGYGTCNYRGAGDPLPNQCDTDGICNPIGGGEGQCNLGPDDKYCDAVTRSNGQGFISCSTNADCAFGTIGIAAGNCTITKRRKCFLDPITATGTPNATKPVGVSVFCIPPTANAAINTVAGIPGPGRVVNQSKNTVICPGGSTYTAGGSCP